MPFGKSFEIITRFWKREPVRSPAAPKIICTLGTTTDDETVLRQMIQYGMAAARINTAYATIPEYKKRIDAVRRLAKIPIILDLKGSQIRLLTDEKYRIEAGDEFAVGFQSGPIAFNYDFFDEISTGDQVFFENGTIRALVAEKRNHHLVLRVIEPGDGHLRNHMGVNVPGKVFQGVPLFSDKDLEVIEFGLKENVEYFAISFVRNIDNVLSLMIEQSNVFLREAKAGRTLLTDRPKTIIKIEDPVGAENLAGIIDEAKKRGIDLTVMIGRGDLFTEAPKYRLPFIQKEIVKICNDSNTEVIVATGLLESMQFSPYPTRSEVCDVANAVFDGADWLMLSAETSNSNHPAEAVKMLKCLIDECQKYSEGREQ